jgi:hypothetical protein
MTFVQVAEWPDKYGCDGIDLDLEEGAGARSLLMPCPNPQSRQYQLKTLKTYQYCSFHIVYHVIDVKLCFQLKTMAEDSGTGNFFEKLTSSLMNGR